MSDREKIILDALIDAHKNNRIKTVTGVSEHTKSAQAITKEWQGEVKKILGFVEKEVISGKNEKIDLVDLEENKAYELKVSGKNCHHEFYKDLIKVITYNLYHKGNELEKLIFISEEFGIEKLKGRLDEKLRKEIIDKHGITIKLERI